MMRRLLIPLAVLALVGCGSSSTSKQAAAPTPTAEATTPAAVETTGGSCSERTKAEATIDLSSPSGGWKAETPLAKLAPRQEVRLYGWSKSNKWSADGPTFHPEDLARLDSDHILFTPSTAREKQTDHGLVHRDRSRQLACP